MRRKTVKSSATSVNQSIQISKGNYNSNATKYETKSLARNRAKTIMQEAHKSSKDLPALKKIKYPEQQRSGSAQKHVSAREGSPTKKNSEEIQKIIVTNDILRRRASLSPVLSPKFVENIKTIAPAKELDPIWDDMVNQSRRRYAVNPMLKEICRLPIFSNMKVLVLENLKLEKIFEYLQPCKSLIGLYLKRNRVITRDLVQIEHLTSLRKVDLSSNEIHFLPDAEKLVRLVNLESLLLHKNLIVGWRQLEILTGLARLQDLTLQGNPCSKLKSYRHYMADNMPQLRSLDKFIVMDFERTEVAKLFPPQNIKMRRLKQLYRFRPFNVETTSWRSPKFQLLDYYAPDDPLSNTQDSLAVKKSRGSKRPNYEESAAGSFIQTENYQVSSQSSSINRHLDKEGYDLRRRFEYCSPILTIQKTVKMFMARKRFKYKKRMIRVMAWGLKRWALRFQVDCWIERIGLTREKLHRIGRVRLIQRTWRIYHRRKYLYKWAAEQMKSLFEMKRSQRQSLWKDLSGQRSSPNCNKLLFRKSQFDMLQRLGLLEQAADMEDSKRFQLRLDLKIDNKLIRRSAVLNLLVSSYRYIVTNRKFSQFQQVVSAIQETVMLTRMLKIMKEDGSETHTDSQYTSQLSALQSARFHQQQESRQTSAIGDQKEGPEAPASSAQADESVLIEVTYASYDHAIEMLKKINEHNWHEPTEDTIQVFYMPFCERLYAIVNVQHWYRSILFRRRLKPIIEVHKTQKRFILTQKSIVGRNIKEDNTQPKHFLLLKSIVLKIQRFFRKWTLRARINSLVNIAKYAAKITTNTLYLEQNIYLNLERIVIDNRLEKRQTLVEKGFRFAVDENDFQVKIDFSKKVDVVGRYYQKPQAKPKQVSQRVSSREQEKKKKQQPASETTQPVSTLPLWFQEKTKTQIPRGIDLFKDFQKKTTGKRQQQKKYPNAINNIMSLIHLQPPIAWHGKESTSPSVLNLNEIAEKTPFTEQKDLKFIKVVYPTVKEARNRAIVLALLSCDIRKPKKSFVQFFQQASFNNLIESQRTCGKIQRLHQALFTESRMFEILDKDGLLAPSNIYWKQPHSGLISKRDEQIKNLMQLIPKKDNNSKFERHIVLPDADPTIINTLLGNVLNSKKIQFSDKDQADAQQDSAEDQNPISLLPKLDADAGNKFFNDTLQNLNIPKVFKQNSRNSFIKKFFKESAAKQKEPIQEIKLLSSKRKLIKDGAKDVLTLQKASQLQKQSSQQKYFTKVQKIGMLKRKIHELKKRVVEHSSVAPGIEKIFNQQLLPSEAPRESPNLVRNGSNSSTLLPKYSKNNILATNSQSYPLLPNVNQQLKTQEQLPSQEEIKNDASRQIKGANTYDYSDRMVKHLQKGNIENQIEQLYNDYTQQKKAYKHVLSMYSGVLDPIHEEKLDKFEDQMEKDLLQQIAADIQDKSITDSLELNSNTFASNESRLQRFAQVIHTNSTTTKSAETRQESDDKLRKTMQIFQFEPAAFKQQQKRFIFDSLDDLQRNLCKSVSRDFQKVVDQKMQNLYRVNEKQKKQKRVILMKKKKEENDFTKAFVNQSNQLMNITHQAFMSGKRKSIKEKNESSAMRVKLQRIYRDNNATKMTVQHQPTDILQTIQSTHTSRTSKPDDRQTISTKFKESQSPDLNMLQTKSSYNMFNDSKSMESLETNGFDKERVQVEIYNKKDISPLLGHKAIKRIISRSQAQLHPITNQVPREITNSVNSRIEQLEHNNPFIKILAQQQAEDRQLLTDRSFNKNMNLRNPNRQNFGLTMNTSSSNKTMLGQTMSNHRFQKVQSDMLDRMRVQEIVRNQQKRPTMFSQLQAHSQAKSGSQLIQLGKQLNEIKEQMSAIKNQPRNEPQMLLKDESRKNRMQHLLTQRMYDLSSQRSKLMHTPSASMSKISENKTPAAGSSSQLHQALKNSSKLLKTATVETVLKRRQASQEKEKKELRSSDIAHLHQVEGRTQSSYGLNDQLELLASDYSDKDTLEEFVDVIDTNYSLEMKPISKVEQGRMYMQAFNGSQSSFMKKSIRNLQQHHSSTVTSRRQAINQGKNAMQNLYNLTQQTYGAKHAQQKSEAVAQSQRNTNAMRTHQISRSQSVSQLAQKPATILPSLIQNQQQSLNRIHGIQSLATNLLQQ